ncbi:3'-5' exoribonuclease YhaM family protein [Desulfurobacterium sp.]
MMDVLVRDIYKMPAGQEFKGFFIIESAEIKKHRTGEPYLRLIVSDRTGTLPILWWKPPKDADLTIFKKGDVVFIEAYVELFQGNVQPKIKFMRHAEKAEFKREKFIKVSRFDVEEQFTKLLEIIETIENPYLKKLLELIFYDDEIASAFMKAPGGKFIHHASIGGLLEHTLGVVEICEVVAKRYKSIDRDLLITAAILHDIGKIDEYSMDVAIDRTDEGILLGHIFTGSELISKKIDEIEGFPKTLKVKLLHCILSHHGEYEFGSPKKPKTLEAVALHYADALDSKVKGYEEHIERELGEGKGWTKRHFAYEVPIYFDGEISYE